MVHTMRVMYWLRLRPELQIKQSPSVREKLAWAYLKSTEKL
jgi:hypothetical protein